MEPTGEKKMNMSSRIGPRTLAFLGVAALLLVLGAVMSVRSQASVAATAVSAPLSVNVAAEEDYAARRQRHPRRECSRRHDYAASWVAGASPCASATGHAAMLERSNAAAAARYAAMAEYYAHGDLMLARPAIGNGSVTSQIAPAGNAYAAIDAATLERRDVAADIRYTATGKSDAGRTAPSEKHAPGGGP